MGSVLDVLSIGSKIIDKLLPDPAMKAKAQLDLMQLQQAGEFKEIDSQLQRDIAQIEVNKEEARSDSLFKGGWRPATGWVCVVGLVYSFLVHPMLVWYSSIVHIPIPPDVDISTLFTMLGGLLGLGSFRSYEKKHGVAAT